MNVKEGKMVRKEGRTVRKEGRKGEYKKEGKEGLRKIDFIPSS